MVFWMSGIFCRGRAVVLSNSEAQFNSKSMCFQMVWLCFCPFPPHQMVYWVQGFRSLPWCQKMTQLLAPAPRTGRRPWWPPRSLLHAGPLSCGTDPKQKYYYTGSGETHVNMYGCWHYPDVLHSPHLTFAIPWMCTHLVCKAAILNLIQLAVCDL